MTAITAREQGERKTCAGCPTTLGPKNRSGKCRSCTAKALNADPMTAERRRAGIVAHYTKPGAREANAARLATYLANMPEGDRQRRREHGRQQYLNHLSRPDVRARSGAPDVRAHVGRSRTNTVLAWCPPELRDAYRGLIRQHHYRAAEARAIIEAEIPGTTAHARRVVQNHIDAQRIRHEREKAQAY